jgi:hypothetical protein
MVPSDEILQPLYFVSIHTGPIFILHVYLCLLPSLPSLIRYNLHNLMAY